MSESLPVIDYSQHPAYGGMFEPEAARRAQAMSILEPLIEEMQKAEAEKAAGFGYRYGHADAPGEELARTGLLRFQLEPAVIDPIAADAKPLLAQIRERVAGIEAAGKIASFKDGLEIVDPQTHAAQWTRVETVLRDVGVHDLTRHFFSAKGAVTKSVAVLVSQPKAGDAMAGPRGDLGQASPTNGFHIDSAGRCILKVVLYLGDVGPGQGPFGMILGSHRWEEGSEGRIYRRAFDRSPLVARGKTQRRMFTSLPPALQVKAEFGGDMLAAWPESQRLAQRESVSIGARGLLSLFDPEAIHRGGLAKTGDREALLITIRAQL